MTDVASLLPLVESANQRLLATVSHWAEADVRQPSGLPGWSRAHVLAHLINNADGARAAAWGAPRELVIDTYPGGPDQRAAEIEGHARWPAEALVRHLRRAMAELQAAWQAMPAEAWTRTIVRSAGARPAWSALAAVSANWRCITWTWRPATTRPTGQPHSWRSTCLT